MVFICILFLCNCHNQNTFFFFCIKYHNFFSLSFLLHLPVYLLSPSISLSSLPPSVPLVPLFLSLSHTHTHTHTVKTMSMRSFNFIRKQQTILIILSANSELTVSLNCLWHGLQLSLETFLSLDLSQWPRRNYFFPLIFKNCISLDFLDGPLF